MSELPKGWVDCKLGDVLTLVNGRAYKKHEMLDTPNGATPILRIQNLNNGDNWFYSDLDLAEDKYCYKGDLLYAWSATFGPYWAKWDKAIFHYHIWNVKPTNAITLRFAYYTLCNITGAIKSAAHGVAMPHMTKSGMEGWSITVPSLAEQKRIVEKLDEVLAQVNTIKARLDGIPDLLKRFRQSVLASAVSGKLIAVKTPRLMTIGDVSEDIRYGTSKKCDYKGGDTPVIRIPNIGDRKLDVSDLKSADFTEKELEKLALKSGDLLVIRSNGSLDLVAKPALVESQYEGFLYAGYLIRIRCDREKVIPSFLLNVLSSRVVRDVVELGARSTSGVNNINSKELSALEFVLPSLEEQKEIVRLIDQYFAFAETIEAQVKKAQARVDNLTQSILAKAFRGELVVQDPNDEPADKLLERIAKARADAEALAKAAKKARSTKSPAKKRAAKSA
ncbi:restriction endonuclease subunit S [Vibrio neptunius]|uniref:restriction endonuclease subunit S n=1 Tax=Vibrio neptunius TaxID=170651 RepID=UPI001C5C84FE|nr:restriction endonuclease subunit S [Vibrio neptunius]QXX07867.1 restriction endonuclease subunit S [Vibrio neptunius]